MSSRLEKGKVMSLRLHEISFPIRTVIFKCKWGNKVEILTEGVGEIKEHKYRRKIFRTKEQEE